MVTGDVVCELGVLEMIDVVDSLEVETLDVVGCDCVLVVEEE